MGGYLGLLTADLGVPSPEAALEAGGCTSVSLSVVCPGSGGEQGWGQVSRVCWLF